MKKKFEKCLVGAKHSITSRDTKSIILSFITFVFSSSMSCKLIDLTQVRHDTKKRNRLCITVIRNIEKLFF